MLVLKKRSKKGGFFPKVKILKKEKKYRIFFDRGSIIYFTLLTNLCTSIPPGHRLRTLKVWYYPSYIIRSFIVPFWTRTVLFVKTLVIIYGNCF